jgi:D-3-phosphoglycerate dehydrogenase
VLRTGIKMTADLLKDADGLMMISRTGAGVDNVDLKAATEKGVLVTSSIGANTTSVAEHCLALPPRPVEAALPLGPGRYARTTTRSATGTCPATSGGRPRRPRFGRIGSMVAKACRDVFDMKIIANDVYLPAEVKKSYASWVEFRDDLDSLFSDSDAITIHIPFVSEAEGMIGKRLLSKMKKGSFIINTARGGIINEHDLADALKNGPLAGAGLDVLQDEPPKKDNPLLASRT